MKKLVVLLLFLVSFCVAQKPTENQRYQIVDLGLLSELKIIFLLDTQTGRCWRLASDSLSLFHKHELDKVINDKSFYPELQFLRGTVYVWEEVFFTTLIPIDSNYTKTPIPVLPTNKKK